jgi:3-hydroxyisobutyrate dehydrogenase-like beta-hydroxyacid dehydrogenase
MARIALLHPGAMGAEVGAALVAVAHEVVWLPAGRSAATRERAEAAGLWAVDDLSGCDVVLSVVPPGAAVATASGIAGVGGLVVDANAISPATAGEVAGIVAAGGATFVDGGIIGPPPARAGTTRLYLSGGAALDVAALFEGARIEARVIDGSASALKMAYASWTKISAALLLAGFSAAGELGVADELVAEWALSQPGLAERLAEARASAEVKGWRWVDEMREIAGTFASVGEPSGFGLSAAEVFSRF